MDWDKLKLFKTIVEAKSFSQASPLLGVSQSALSRQMSALEQDLGVMLFHRHPRGILLTEQGELLYQTVLEVFDKVSSVCSHLTESKDVPTGELRVTSTVGLGSLWLTPLIPEFLDCYPNIFLTLILDDRELDLSMREADVAIRLRRPIQSYLVQRKLFTVHYHVYASPLYLERRGVPRTIGDLDHHDLLSFGTSPAYLSEINWIQTIGRHNGQGPRASLLRVNNVYGLKKAVEAGLGLASLPDYIARGDDRLVHVDLGIPPPYFDTYFTYPQEQKNSKKISVFRDFILEKSVKWDF